MADKSKIEWTEATWNPVTGCTKVSPGCDNCYAETFAERWRGTAGHPYERGFDLTLRPERLDQPLRWKRPRRVFVNSMSDLFHDDIPDEFLVRMFAVMALAGQHTFQVLTKRHGRMRSLLNTKRFQQRVKQRQSVEAGNPYRAIVDVWPLPNVWLGVSVESQKWANTRIPALLDTPAAVRWLSMEPLLGPVDLHAKDTRTFGPQWLPARAYGVNAPDGLAGDGSSIGDLYKSMYGPNLDWVVVGGESGRNARPMHPDWVRTLRDQCTAVRVPFFLKQWGEWAPVAKGDEGSGPFRIVPEYAHGEDGPFEHGWAMRRLGKRAAGRELDGRTWDEYPL